MRKHYIYAITMIIIVLSLWTGYYLYLQHQPVVYENGTFVEVPMEKTKEAMREKCVFLEDISAERIQVELVKLLKSPHPDYLREAYELGMTKVILPEFDKAMETPQNNPHHLYNVGEHMLHTLLYIRPERSLRIAALLHDIAKPATKKYDPSAS